MIQDSSKKRYWLRFGLVFALAGVLIGWLSLGSDTRYIYKNSPDPFYETLTLILWSGFYWLVGSFSAGAIVGYAYQHRNYEFKNFLKWSITPFILAFVGAGVTDSPGSPASGVVFGFFIILALIFGVIGWFYGKIKNRSIHNS